MRLMAAWLMAIFATAGGANPGPPPPPVVTTFHLPNRQGVTYAYSIINPKTHRVSLKAFSPAAEIAAVPGKIACKGLTMTAGFSRRTNHQLMPEGLLRSGNDQFSVIARWRDGGMFSLGDDGAHVTRIADWKLHPLASDLIAQGKPLLVFNGKVDNDLTHDARQNRVGIGVLSDGNIVLIVALTPRDNAVSYAQFASDALKIVGPKLTALLNMDGGPSSFMLSSAVRYLPGTGSITTYFCVEKR